ncbi:MAG: hypothetical protein AB8G05_06815 [Oligoflexales bacterium]
MKWVLVVVQLLSSANLYGSTKLRSELEGGSSGYFVENLVSFELSPRCVHIEHQTTSTRKLWPFLSHNDFSRISRFIDSMFSLCDEDE